MSNEKACCVRFLRHTGLDMPEKLDYCVVCPNCWLLNILESDPCHCITNSGAEFSGLGIHTTRLQSHMCCSVSTHVVFISVLLCFLWARHMAVVLQHHDKHNPSPVHCSRSLLGLWVCGAAAVKRCWRTVTSPCGFAVSSSTVLTRNAFGLLICPHL